MSKISALIRITTKEHQFSDQFNHILLNKDVKQVFIGRDVGCDHRISSIEISRKHALIQFSVADDYWLISDLNSTNGLFVNSEQLSSNSPHRLVSGDRVSFGPPPQTQFLYQFTDNLIESNNNCYSYELSAIGLTSIPVIPIVTRIQTNSSDQVLTQSLRFDIESNQSRTVSLTANMPTRSGVNYSVSGTRSPRMTVMTTGSPVSRSHDKIMSRKSSSSAADLSTFVEHDYSRSSNSKNSTKRVTHLRLKDNSSSGQKAREVEKKRIDKEKKKLATKAKMLFQKEERDRQKIKRKEQELKRRQKELDKKEREAKKREEKIEKMKEKLKEEKKEFCERREQLSQMTTVRESAKRKLRSDSVRETKDSKRLCSDSDSGSHSTDSLKRMEDILESELTCSVCSEYFIQSVVLNCSHTFCLYCIEQWKRSKNACPICREEITNYNRELLIDNMIDRFLTEINPKLKEHRKELMTEREKLLEKKAREVKPTANRGGIASIIPSLHFFLRQSVENSDSDSDSDDYNVIGFGFDNNISSSSSSSSSSSDDSSDSDVSDDSSDSDDDIIDITPNTESSTRAMATQVSASRALGPEHYVPIDSDDSDSDNDSLMSIMSAHSNDSDSNDSSDDSIFSIDD